MFVTIAIQDIEHLDRLTHALLIAKAMYCSDAVQTKSGADWRWANGNLDALNALYAQLNAALEMIDA